MISRRPFFRFNRGRLSAAGGENGGENGGGLPPDTTPPALSGPPEVLADGWTIRLLYNEALDTSAGGTPAAGAFALTNTPIAVESVTMGANYVDLGVSAYISAHETTIGVTYVPGANPIRDVALNNALGFVDETVDNNATLTLYRPVGYGTNLVRDMIAGSDFWDLGSGGIAQWHDQSTFAHHLVQTDVARQPAPNETVDTKACVRFDKANTEWFAAASSAFAALLSGANIPFVFCWYGQAVVAVNNGVLWSAGNSVAGGGITHLSFPTQVGGSSVWRAQRTSDSGTSHNRSGTPNVTSDQRFFCTTFDGAILTATVDGGAVTWSASDAWNVGTCTFGLDTLGCNRNSSFPTGGTFGDYRVIRASWWVGGTLPDAAALAAWRTGVAL